MKKLILLALVLGMASMASAAITWTLGGSDVSSVNVPLGETVTVEITSDNDLAYGLGAAFLGTYEVPVYSTITGITATAAAGSDYEIADVGGTYPNFWTVLAKDVTDPFTVAPGIQFNVTFTAGTTLGSNSWMLDEESAAGGPTDYLTVNVVPEPMTLALLGLGGLFLRRRK